MQRFLLGILILMLAFPIDGDAQSLMLDLLVQKPEKSFSEMPAPSAPNYANHEHWAALPCVADMADVVPADLPSHEAIDQCREAKVDVFFVHPTTFRGATWNASLADVETNERTDKGTIRNQASVFNGCCSVYAPRYRQSSLYAALEGKDNELQARDLAYGDVLLAFDYYLKEFNRGRPFILAGHSQGSRYIPLLLAERITASRLRQQFVVAYDVGVPLPTDWLGRNAADIRLCQDASDSGCVVTWNTWGAGAEPRRFSQVRHRYSGLWELNGDKPIACINPLNWSTTAKAPHSSNLGAWSYGQEARAQPLAVGLVNAWCERGALYIDEPKGRRWRRGKLPGDNYHNYDYQLFWMNIRINAQERIDAFMKLSSSENQRSS